MYVVEFVNGEVHNLKTTQLTKAKDGVKFDDIVNVDESGGGNNNGIEDKVAVIENKDDDQDDNNCSDTEDLQVSSSSYQMKLKRVLEYFKS